MKRNENNGRPRVKFERTRPSVNPESLLESYRIVIAALEAYLGMQRDNTKKSAQLHF